jgi:hypothetical protein
MLAPGPCNCKGPPGNLPVSLKELCFPSKPFHCCHFLPSLCLCLDRVYCFYELLVCEALAVRAFRGLGKTRTIVVLAFVEATYLLLNVPLQMLWTRSDVCPFDRALEHRPEAFNVVRVYVVGRLRIQSHGL